MPKLHALMAFEQAQSDNTSPTTFLLLAHSTAI